MPTDLETQALIERDMLDRLTAEFQALPRSLRRRISRDTARHYARPGDRNGKTVDRVHAQPPMPAPRQSPRSGQTRIDVKRNARAVYWRFRRNAWAARDLYRGTRSLNAVRADLGLERI